MASGITLSRCSEFTRQRIDEISDAKEVARLQGKKVKVVYLGKDDKEIARLLVNACSQYSVAERLAEEWDLLGPGIRMAFTDLANSGWRSGNVTKGLAHLDKLLGGRIFRREYVEKERALKKRDGKSYVAYRSPVSPAVTGAQIAFAAFGLPANYQKLSPAEKKRIRDRLARERRAMGS